MVTREAQLHEAGAAEREFDLDFRFELATVELSDGTQFFAEQEALKRWQKFSVSEVDWIGTSFDLLYELRDGRFIQIRHEWCHQRKFPDGYYFTSDFSPSGRVVAPSTAARFILALREPLPDHLENAYEEWQRAEKLKAFFNARPLSFWSERTPLGRLYDERLTSERLLVRIEVVAKGLFLFVENFCGRLEENADRARYEPMSLGAELWAQDAFNADRWDWSTGKHHPPRIDWLNAPWPQALFPIHTILMRVRELLDSPFPCLMHLWHSESDVRPTEVELDLAVRVIRKGLTNLERQSCVLQEALRAFRQKQKSGELQVCPLEKWVMPPANLVPGSAGSSHGGSFGRSEKLPKLKFVRGGYIYRGKEYRMGKSLLRIFHYLATSPNRSILESEAYAKFWVANSVQKASVVRAFSRLGAQLCSDLELPPGFDPVAKFGFGPDLGWDLKLEFLLVDNPDFISEFGKQGRSRNRRTKK